ncbi:hypothetical protein IKC_06191 [Bacillus cereus VD184]|uniref:Uncharacterized protein n=2 Tax=Bacillus cereus TaxID=1396 RepID=A0A9W5R0F7_BACCE|nr:hypothetical protein IKC_06191 [Bacillus cereus VD184]
MESCTCINCTGDNFHLEQMAEEIISKDDYMENKPPSVYEKLEELNQWTMSPTQNELMGDIMEAVNAIDNELISLAVELPPEQAEKLLDIQMRLY